MQQCQKSRSSQFKEGIRWNFIPPRSPRKGGLWEAAVKSMKHYLVKATNGEALTSEQYGTLFAEIERILNSRPLCYHKTTPLITPSHFLIGDLLLSLPDPEKGSPISLSARYELLKNQVNSFWKYWRADYLTQLQKKIKSLWTCERKM